MKSLLIICDGMADRLTGPPDSPSGACRVTLGNGTTPLESAKTPNMDKLAKQGRSQGICLMFCFQSRIGMKQGLEAMRQCQYAIVLRQASKWDVDMALTEFMGNRIDDVGYHQIFTSGILGRAWFVNLVKDYEFPVRIVISPHLL